MNIKVDLRGNRGVVGAASNAQSEMLLVASEKIASLESKDPATLTKAEVQDVLSLLVKIAAEVEPAIRSIAKRGMDLAATLVELQSRLIQVYAKAVSARKAASMNSPDQSEVN